MLSDMSLEIRKRTKDVPSGRSHVGGMPRGKSQRAERERETESEEDRLRLSRHPVPLSFSETKRPGIRRPRSPPLPGYPLACCVGRFASLNSVICVLWSLLVILGTGQLAFPEAELTRLSESIHLRLTYRCADD